MYLQRLHLKNVRLIESLELDFTRSGRPRMWTVLLGENGLCKTTILQAIGLAAVGPNKGNQLLNVPKALRPIETSANVDVEATFQLSTRVQKAIGMSDGVPTLHSNLRLANDWNELQGSSWFSPGTLSTAPHTEAMVELRGKALPDYFVAGYGVTRTLPFPNSTAEPGDSMRDRLRSLFDPSWRLIATDFISRVGSGPDAPLARRFAEVLQRVLSGDGGLLPNISHLELRGRGGVTRPEDLVEAHRFIQSTGVGELAIPATWLSQGYQSTIAWVADLVGQIFVDTPVNASLDPTDYEGLVLVDEIDLHLHPRWQRHIVRGLKRVFPKLQFVVTTHSPLVLAGLEADEVVQLQRGPGGRIVVTENRTNPGLLTPTELLTQFFGLDDTFPGEVGQQMQKYVRLALNPFRDDDEDAQVEQLGDALRAQNAPPMVQPVPRKAGSAS
jgi:predicted ATPase